MRRPQDYCVGSRESLETWGFRLGLLSCAALPWCPGVTGGVWLFLGICWAMKKGVQWVENYWTEVAAGRR